MMKKLFVSALFVGLAAVAASAQQNPPAPAASADLKVRDPAPAFSLPGTDGKTYTLAGLKGKAIVIAWYPKAMTTGCTAECRSIRDNSETITKFDVAYFMASVDTQEDNKKFADQEQVNFPMLSDTDKKVAMAYGVVPLSGAGLAKRWTFFIGPDGKIQHIEKVGHTADAGTFLTAKLTELGVKKK